MRDKERLTVVYAAVQDGLHYLEADAVVVNGKNGKLSGNLSSAGASILCLFPPPIAAMFSEIRSLSFPPPTYNGFRAAARTEQCGFERTVEVRGLEDAGGFL